MYSNIICSQKMKEKMITWLNCAPVTALLFHLFNNIVMPDTRAISFHFS